MSNNNKLVTQTIIIAGKPNSKDKDKLIEKNIIGIEKFDIGVAKFDMKTDAVKAFMKWIAIFGFSFVCTNFMKEIMFPPKVKPPKVKPIFLCKECVEIDYRDEGCKDKLFFCSCCDNSVEGLILNKENISEI